MSRRNHLVLLLLCLLSLPCATVRAQQGGDYKAQLEKDFRVKQAALSYGHLFDIFNTSMTPAEREAMQFLYAYMPANDVADYEGEFFLANVRASLQVRGQVSWQVPDDVFRHFVLPVRVNNENLDSARMVFQKELLPRVKGLNLHDAVLEVNHWCHEKVNYTPSDIRTSAPLSTMRTAWGRCGEESTFLVAALRSVGIPARQVYTPRWAHTDDNHAWVEAWVDGKWHFLGACEPEPVLDLGWFNAPASRGMLMHTKVFGRYFGPEEVMSRTATFTEINVISNYAANAPITVVVKDEKGKPVKGARVEFRIYNYGEFYPVSRQTTAADGAAKLSAGLGDMMVLAVSGQRFGVTKVSFGKEREAVVVLDRKIGVAYEVDMDLVPPAEHPNLPAVTPEQRAENDRRFACEDSIRNAYRATFLSGGAKELAEQWGDPARKYLTKSQGNWRCILDILQRAKTPAEWNRTLDLLSTLSDKDLRDVPYQVLVDALDQTAVGSDVRHVLAPRVANERLVPYRAYLIREMKPVLGKDWGNVRKTIDFCKKQITLREDLTVACTYASPIGVARARVADAQSLGVFFVALCRTQGIPAWVDMVTGNVFYEEQGRAVHVDLTGGSDKPLRMGKLQLAFEPQAHQTDPEYYIHFTLSRFTDGHTFSLLNYDDGNKWSDTFKEPAEVEAGYYLMSTGTRLGDGTVLSRLKFFTVGEQATAKSDICLREQKGAVTVIGNFNSESAFTEAESGAATTILKSAGRGYYVLGLLAVGQEPTNHALRDIAARAAELEKWGRKMVLLFASRADYEKYLKAPISGLPSTVVFGIDTDGSIGRNLREAMKLQANTPLPVFVIGDTFNRVVFESHGYTIGLGDQMLKLIHGL